MPDDLHDRDHWADEVSQLVFGRPAETLQPAAHGLSPYQRLTLTLEEMLEALEAAILAECHWDGECWDSNALSHLAYGLELLADLGRVEIVEARGRRVFAKKVER